jgi:hypothetical protein
MRKADYLSFHAEVLPRTTKQTNLANFDGGNNCANDGPGYLDDTTFNLSNRSLRESRLKHVSNVLKVMRVGIFLHTRGVLSEKSKKIR